MQRHKLRSTLSCALISKYFYDFLTQRSCALRKISNDVTQVECFQTPELLE